MNNSKFWKRRIFSLLLALTLLCGGMAPAILAMEADAATTTPEDGIRALSQLIAAHDEETFFSAMTLTAGETEAAIDGEPLPLNEAPAISGGQALLPKEAIAAVRELPAAAARFRADDHALVTQSEAETLGLEVEILPEDGTILVTAPFQTRRLLVKTADGTLDNTFSATTVLSLSDNRFVLQYDTEQAAKDACLWLEANPLVLYAEPDGVLTAGHLEFRETASAEATAAAVQASETVQAAGTVQATGTGWGSSYIGAADFQAKLPANPTTITVAVLDTGVDVSHTMFAGRISDVRWNFVNDNKYPTDAYGHGTHVSGIVVDSTASNVKIMPLKVLDDEGNGYDSVIIEAVRYAVDKGAKVVNMSLSGIKPKQQATLNGWIDAIAYAASRGVTLCGSTGNDGKNDKHYPAAFSGVIAVAASTSSDSPASFSNYGTHTDIGAPGVDIRSAYPGNQYRWANGTSMSTPYVSAAAALLLSYRPNMPQNAILPYLQATSTPWTTSTQLHGAGVVNLTPRTSITPRGIILDEGQTADISSVFACPPVSYANAAFTSNVPAVAATTQNGGILALRPGSAVVSAQSASLNASVPVKVREIVGTAAANASVTIKQISMSATPTKTRYELGKPLNIAGGKLRIDYSDGVVSTINLTAGMLRTVFNPNQMGAQKINMELGGKTTSFTVTVYPTGTPASLTLTYKKTYPKFPNGGNTAIFWKSSNNKVLVVNANGSIEYKGPGTATIYTVIKQNGADVVIAETKVTVKFTFWQWIMYIVLFGWIWM